MLTGEDHNFKRLPPADGMAKKSLSKEQSSIPTITISNSPSPVTVQAKDYLKEYRKKFGCKSSLLGETKDTVGENASNNLTSPSSVSSRAKSCELIAKYLKKDYPLLFRKDALDKDKIQEASVNISPNSRTAAILNNPDIVKYLGRTSVSQRLNNDDGVTQGTITCPNSGIMRESPTVIDDVNALTWPLSQKLSSSQTPCCSICNFTSKREEQEKIFESSKPDANPKFCEPHHKLQAGHRRFSSSGDLTKLVQLETNDSTQQDFTREHDHKDDSQALEPSMSKNSSTKTSTLHFHIPSYDEFKHLKKAEKIDLFTNGTSAKSAPVRGPKGGLRRASSEMSLIDIDSKNNPFLITDDANASLDISSRSPEQKQPNSSMETHVKSANPTKPKIMSRVSSDTGIQKKRKNLNDDESGLVRSDSNKSFGDSSTQKQSKNKHEHSSSKHLGVPDDTNSKLKRSSSDSSKYGSNVNDSKSNIDLGETYVIDKNISSIENSENHHRHRRRSCSVSDKDKIKVSRSHKKHGEKDSVKNKGDTDSRKISPSKERKSRQKSDEDVTKATLQKQRLEGEERRRREKGKETQNSDKKHSKKSKNIDSVRRHSAEVVQPVVDVLSGISSNEHEACSRVGSFDHKTVYSRHLLKNDSPCQSPRSGTPSNEINSVQSGCLQDNHLETSSQMSPKLKVKLSRQKVITRSTSPLLKTQENEHEHLSRLSPSLSVGDSPRSSPVHLLADGDRSPSPYSPLLYSSTRSSRTGSKDPTHSPRLTGKVSPRTDNSSNKEYREKLQKLKKEILGDELLKTYDTDGATNKTGSLLSPDQAGGVVRSTSDLSDKKRTEKTARSAKHHKKSHKSDPFGESRRKHQRSNKRRETHVTQEASPRDHELLSPRESELLNQKKQRFSVNSTREDILNFLDEYRKSGYSTIDETSSIPSLDEFDHYDNDSSSETVLTARSGRHSQLSNMSNDSDVNIQDKTNKQETNLQQKGAEVERVDSGVGSETKAVPQRRIQEVDPQAIVCEDCDKTIEAESDSLDDDHLLSFVCHKCQSKRIERCEGIKEIVDTEISYGRDLQIIKEEFLIPMKTAGLLTPEQLGTIFINIEELYEINKKFASSLQDSVDMAMETGDEDLTTVIIGNIFLEYSNMLLAFENYCVNQSSSTLLLEQLEREKELLRIFLYVSQTENSLLRRMNLKSFLMIPVQRIMKYPLLLGRLHKTTPVHHKDKSVIKEAQHRIEQILEHINNKTKGSAGLKVKRRHSRKNTTVENLELVKMALEILGWNRQDAHVVTSGKVLLAQPSDSTWAKKAKSLKYQQTHGVLITLGKPNYYDVNKDSLVFPKSSHVKQAALVLIKEKGGKYLPLREPVFLDKALVSMDSNYTEAFELIEFGEDFSLIKSDDPSDTLSWFNHLKHQTMNLGHWRKRRPAFANIMMQNKTES